MLGSFYDAQTHIFQPSWVAIILLRAQDKAMIQVINLQDKVVKQLNIPFNTGHNTFTTNITDLPKGSYSLKIKSQTIQYKQFLKL